MALTKVTTGTIADDSIQSLKNRNLIINGAMQVAQRATQVTGSTSGGYLTCDRFGFVISALGTWTVDQSTDSPNGFSNSLKFTCTTADASPAASSYALIKHAIEAQNLQHLAYGTADAKSMTLSFWVKSNKTGSATFSLLQRDNSSRLFSYVYTISSANTWEYKTISIPADTSGLFNNDNGIGADAQFWLNSGSNYIGGGATSGWEAYSGTKQGTSNLGVGGAVNDYFAITGVQLEVGDVATPFEHESYGETLAKCQRYYYVYVINNAYQYTSNGGYGNTTAHMPVSFPVSMRSQPSGSLSDTTASNYEYYSQSNAWTDTTVVGTQVYNTEYATWYIVSDTTSGVLVRRNGVGNAEARFVAEL